MRREQPRVLRSQHCHARADLMLRLALTSMLREERLAYLELAEIWRRRAEEAATREAPKGASAAAGPEAGAPAR